MQFKYIALVALMEPVFCAPVPSPQIQTGGLSPSTLCSGLSLETALPFDPIAIACAITSKLPLPGTGTGTIPIGGSTGGIKRDSAGEIETRQLGALATALQLNTLCQSLPTIPLDLQTTCVLVGAVVGGVGLPGPTG